ncbi:Vacuolar-sorting receptor 1 [Glycine soja]|uniref:Vacuolar-sorting receptor 1 n=1 Tax=Glycine soja TaxID=3848 RepID=A0A445J0J2_GLYSO|nr:Vacuolar-sorting receptor 1 [Glycine soja]
MTFLTSIVVSLTHSQSLFFLGFLVLFLSLPSSMAKFVVEKNSLTVTSSDNIKGTHDRAIWNFRILQYEGSIVGNILYPKDNKKGCKEFDEYGISFKSKPSALPTTVLLDRGSKILLPSNLFMFDFKVPLEVVTPLDVKLLNGSRLVLEGLGWNWVRATRPNPHLGIRVETTLNDLNPKTARDLGTTTEGGAPSPWHHL